MPSILIGIAGPSGAGKSLFCRRLERSHTNIGRLKLDDFYCDEDEVNMLNGYQNWDDPSSLDWDACIEAAIALKSGKSAIVPHYDRALNRCIGEKCLIPKEIIVVDGFLTLYHPDLRAIMDTSFFFTIPEPEQIARRKARQPWVQDGYLREVMLPSARTHVMPSAIHATHIIDASLTPEAIYREMIEHFRILSINITAFKSPVTG